MVGRALLRPLLTASLLAGAAAAARGAPAATSADSVRYAIGYADINRIGLTVTNYGFFGNNFNSRAASFEYPLGSGYEHMARAGLWVGAKAVDDQGAFTGVSTAIVDNYQGTSALVEDEFTPASLTVHESSRIANSDVYSPLAASDQDLTCSYSDMPARLPSGYQTEPHRPLQILVQQRTMGFTLRAAGSFTVVQFKIVNLGPPLRDVHVGLYAQLVSGNKGAYSRWPPTASDIPGTWYYKTYPEYDAARRLYKEHFCAAEPYPTNCNFAYCPPWAGVKLLCTKPDTIADKMVTFHHWSISLGDTLRDTDLKRFALMSDGVIDTNFSSCHPGMQSCSPIMVLSVGPWPELDPGDSIRVDYAFVCGNGSDMASSESDFLTNADFAQFTSDINYQLPSPPPSPKLHVEAHADSSDRVDVYWDDFPEHVPDPTSTAPEHLDFEGYRVYLGLDRQHPDLVAQFDRADPPHDTTGFNTGMGRILLTTPARFPGDTVTYRYRYSVDHLKTGFKYFGAVTSYDLGDTKVESLESGISQNKFEVIPAPGPNERSGGITVFPNPYRVEARWDLGRRVRDHYLWFANLPQRCMLRIYTLSGDKIFETSFDGASYRGGGSRGIYDPTAERDVRAPYLSGATYGWNMITSEGQAAATGLYLWSVENLDTGKVSRGKFLIVKSDREE
ncbi:MAG TPA: hypothetical protein VMS88_06595 [Terriglobales bacterium]|nr:hypothetical protein [Terriglobales bacterium]